MINFYRSSIPHAAKHQAPLNKYLINCKKNDKTVIQWNTESNHAFECCKQDIRQLTTLAYPDSNAQIALMTDASLKCAGTVLQQRRNTKWEPIAFFSKSFSEAQTKYFTYDRELLGIYMAIKHFRRLIEGREFTVYTDHKPLMHAFDKKLSLDDTPRRIRYLDYISQFSTDIQHINGHKNVVADALSRVIETLTLPSAIDWHEVEKYQKSDSELKRLKANKSLKIELIHFPNKNIKIYCDISTGKQRPFMPLKFRKTIFESFHNISHPGKNTTRKLISANYIWENMNKDVNEMSETCLQCQRAKIHRHTKSQFGEFMPTGRFSHLHIDLVGPLPTSQNKRYIITMIDRCTSWPEAFPIADITAETVARTVYEGWIARFGCPEYITTDQGRQFESEIFKNLANLMGVQKIRTTPYHPQSNSKVERLHRTLKTALIARGNTINWTKELATVLFGIRTSLRQDTGFSAAELVYGSTIRLPGAFFETQNNSTYADFVREIKDNLEHMISCPQRQSKNDKIFVHPQLAECRHVFLRCDRLRPSLTPPYEGPYLVISRNDKIFTILINGQQKSVAIDRLKPAFILNNSKISERTIGDKITESSQADKQTETRTRSGRVSHQTVRFQL